MKYEGLLPPESKKCREIPSSPSMWTFNMNLTDPPSSLLMNAGKIPITKVKIEKVSIRKTFKIKGL